MADVEAVEAEAVRVVDDRHEQAVGDGDRDADVDGLAPPVALVGPVGVEVGVLAQGLDAGLGHEGDVARARCPRAPGSRA